MFLKDYPQRFRRGAEGLTYLFAILLTGLVTWFALDLRHARITLPWAYMSDAILPQSAIKTVVETGWYESEPLLNAPAGEVMHDYKVADNLLFIFGKFGALFTDNPFAIVNTYFLLGFFLAAICSLWFFRLLGVGRIIAVGLSVIYAIAPYHFARGEYHLILSEYWPLPLVFGAVYLIVRGRPIWEFRTMEGQRRWWGAGSAVMTFVALVIVGTANSYYAFFALLFIAFFGFARLLFTRNWKAFVGALVAGVALVSTMLINMLPDMIYTQQNGANYLAVQRGPFGVEFYSMRLTELLLPVPGHRISALASIRNFYMTTFNVGGEQPVLGAWAALGFLGLIFASLGLVAFRQKNVELSESGARLRSLTGMTLFAFLMGTVGGFSSIIGLFTSDLRGWNRISILISLFGLTAVGLVLNLVVRWVVKKAPKDAWVAILVSILISGFVIATGYLDQITSYTAPKYEEINEAFAKDEAMVKQIESTVGASASIVQLPYREFPESNGQVPDTEQLKPNLHSNTLKWTAGGIKGRPTSEWVSFLQERSGEDILRSSADAGFQGILIDTGALQVLDKDLALKVRNAYGAPTFTAQDGRYEFYSLTTLPGAGSVPVTSSGKLIGEMTVKPVTAQFVPDVTKSFQGLDVLKKYIPQILLDNPRSEPALVHVEFNMKNVLGTTTFNVVSPDGHAVQKVIGPEFSTMIFDVVAPPGRSSLFFNFVSGAAMPDRIRSGSPLVISDLSIRDVVLDKLLSGASK